MAAKKTTTKRAAAKKTPAKRATAKKTSTRSRKAVAVEEEYPPAPAGSTSLVIVESPAKAKTIGKYLGRAYRVRATVGHIMDLPAKKLGIATVATVRWTSDQMLRRLLPEGSEPEWRDASGLIRIEVREAPDPWVGPKVSALESIGTKVAFVTRLGEARMAVSDLVVQDGDMLHLVMPESKAAEVLAAVEQGPEDH